MQRPPNPPNSPPGPPNQGIPPQHPTNPASPTNRPYAPPPPAMGAYPRQNFASVPRNYAQVPRNYAQPPGNPANFRSPNFRPQFGDQPSPHRPPAFQQPQYSRYAYPPPANPAGAPVARPGPDHAGSPGPAPAGSTPFESILERLKQDFPGMPEKTLATAVRTRKTYEDSLSWLRQMQDRKLMPSAPQAVPAPRHQSIRQKFMQRGPMNGQMGAVPPMPMPGQMPGPMPNQMHMGHPAMGAMPVNGNMHGMPAPGVPQMPPPMNGMAYPPNYGYNFAPYAYSPQPYAYNSSTSHHPPPSLAKKRPNLSDDELSDDDMSDSDDYDPQEAAEFDARLLNFLNTATAEAIADVSTQPLDHVQILVKKRPFVTLAQAGRVDLPTAENVNADGKRRRGAARKSVGLKIIDAARTTLRGYEAVDSLIKECSRLGKVVHQGIAKWQLEEDSLEAKGTGFFREQPALLSEGTVLKNYQQVGINWLNLLYNDKLSCILADEMGLGKTLQVIAFLAHLKANNERGPHLVVCPASTLENWLREFAKFWPTARVEAYYGAQPERREIREDILERPNSYDVMVTTYNLATGQKPDVGFLKSLGFNVVVYDEGHLLKNSQSERYNKLMKLRARFRVLLTGTPLQNNLRELVSLLSFILPHLFTENKDDLLEVFKFKAKATTSESEKSREDLLSEQRIRKAKTMMQPFILRRRKEQVLQHLPPKTHEVITCEMTSAQQAIYEREMKRNKQGIRTARNEVDTSQTGTKKAQREAGKQLDNVLMQLRKAALHPLLFRDTYTDAKLKKMARAIMDEDVYKEANESYIFEDMQVMNDFELDRLCRKFPVTLGEYVLGDEAYTDSGKAKKLKEMLIDMLDLAKPEAERDTENGNRVLLFSQFTLVLDILQRILDVMGIKYLRMDGQTPVEARQDMIDQFHEDLGIKVFLLSTKAGGFGINLAVANRVIIFDLSFNPHDDKQAEDRAHRVGQTRPVQVTRLITKNTIEENILELANTKLALDKQVSEDTGLDDEEEIDTEKEAYVATQLLGPNDNDNDNDEEDDDEDDDRKPTDEEGNGTEETKLAGAPASSGPEDPPKEASAARPEPEGGPAINDNSDDNSDEGEEEEDPAVAPTTPPRAPRRRGRPAKIVEPEVLSEDDDDDSFDSEDDDSPPPRKRRNRDAAPPRARRLRRTGY